MRRLWLVFTVMAMLSGQGIPPTSPDTNPNSPNNTRLPNGKLQRDEIIKAEHKKNVEDAATLARLAQEVKDDIDNSDSYIVSVKTLKKIDDIDKLAKGIRGRLARN
jgi:hypothetical protein